MTDVDVYKDGTHDKTIAFRIDDPSRDGWKMIVCGLCVPADQSDDARTSAGHYLCETCGEKLGRPEAHQRATEIPTEEHDCPTCKHTWKATCLADEYKKLSPREQRQFWKESEVPCRFWEKGEGKEDDTCHP